MSSNTPPLRRVMTDGLWHNNPGLVQLLGLCPLLAVSNTAVNGLGLGLATLVTLLVSSTIVSLIKRWLRDEIRLLVYVLIIATAVTVIELSLQAFLNPLYKTLGIFIPLIVTNCMIVGRAESFASRQPVRLSIVDALAQGTGFLAVLVLLGGCRELLGHGTLFRDADTLFSALGHIPTITVVHFNDPFLFALLPPGAFVTLGLLLALKNIVDDRQTARADNSTADLAKPLPTDH